MRITLMLGPPLLRDVYVVCYTIAIVLITLRGTGNLDWYWTATVSPLIVAFVCDWLYQRTAYHRQQRVRKARVQGVKVGE